MGEYEIRQSISRAEGEISSLQADNRRLDEEIRILRLEISRKQNQQAEASRACVASRNKVLALEPAMRGRMHNSFFTKYIDLTNQTEERKVYEYYEGMLSSIRSSIDKKYSKISNNNGRISSLNSSISSLRSELRALQEANTNGV